ncbi:MAG: hypothetical protein L3K13_01640 [Thermoplasmata archaeon]|nr:hypothetical protein [Thermoplasmata archaeon]
MTIYAWHVATPPGSAGESRPPWLVPGGITPANTYGTRNGLGGCAAPGPGGTEYCYTFQLVGMSGGLALSGRLVGASGYATTADVNFRVQAPVTPTTNLSFANVTLLNTAGQLLATYTEPSGWVASGGATLPIDILSTQTFVLNVGTTSVRGDSLLVYEIHSGQSLSVLT